MEDMLLEVFPAMRLGTLCDRLEEEFSLFSSISTGFEEYQKCD